MTTYNWSIDSMIVNSQNNLSNVVAAIYYRVEAANDVYNATVTGNIPIEYDATDPFIEYNSLSQDTVLTWVQERLGNAAIVAIQSDLDNQINALANPPITVLSPPWV